MANADQVLALFEQINRIPRCSGKERKMSDWLCSWAAERGLVHEQDEAGNVLIRVPATVGLEEARVVALQGHMDMVCEKTPNSSHNFETDPIPVVVDGEWLRAEDTTLGADNGIAIALALAVADSDAPHPELEILVTVDEETGLTGAQKLRSDWLRGTHLLNIDSEDEGVFTVGCAGGRDTILTLRIEREPLPDLFVTREISVSGLQGGHSGVDIHLGRANANVLLARTLIMIRGSGGCKSTVHLVALRGGQAHNAIPRDASAIVAGPPQVIEHLDREIARIQKTFRTEYGSLEPNLQLSLRSAAHPSDMIAETSAKRLLDLLRSLPHGVIRMSSDVPDLVETSTNLATVRVRNDEAQIRTSQRSSYASRLAEIAGQIKAIGRLAGAEMSSESSYPPWEPHMESELLGRAVEAYQAVHGKEPAVEVIHAGLECGVIGAKYPTMQMISFGPTIQNTHSPDERLYLPSLGKTCSFIDALLASYRES